jgi:TRAP-type C4-dicarboxylate transport system permease small subunit
MLFTNAVLAADDAKISDLTNLAKTNIPTASNIGNLLTGAGFNLLDLIFVIVGLGFFTNLVMAGWDYMLSSGDPKKIAVATTRVTNGFIGLIMAITAFLVVRTVVQLLGLEGIV